MVNQLLEFVILDAIHALSQIRCLVFNVFLASIYLLALRMDLESALTVLLVASIVLKQTRIPVLPVSLGPILQLVILAKVVHLIALLVLILTHLYVLLANLDIILLHLEHAAISPQYPQQVQTAVKTAVPVCSLHQVLLLSAPTVFQDMSYKMASAFSVLELAVFAV